ncbi:MAG: glycogen synthase [Acidimicrobiales bacterium]
MHILFATAELRPLVSTGGLGEAAWGLVEALRRAGHEVDVVVPDYRLGGEPWPLAGQAPVPALDLPAWAQEPTVRHGTHPDAGPVFLVGGPGLDRPHPYVDASGVGYPDNDLRFAAFSVAVGQLANRLRPDLVQLNDWHTGLVPPFLDPDIASVLTIHNLAHQGWTNGGWLHELPRLRRDYARGDAMNVLAGAIRTVDAVVAVSRTYAGEITTPAGGMGLDDVLRWRGDDLHGIRNGIDTLVWDPATDPLIPRDYTTTNLAGKSVARAVLLDRFGWDEPDKATPTMVMVTRLFDQKGVDLAFALVPYLRRMRARFVVLGSGEEHLADRGRTLMGEHPDHFAFVDGFDLPLAHLLFAGGDLYLMPSRFEPCGLAQMQAMAYGTIPLVTPVGGLVDTVTDADDSSDGTGFVATSVDGPGVVDVVHRGVAAWRNAARRRAIIRRAMSTDWSWDGPAAAYAAVYRKVMERPRPAAR